MFNNKTFLLHRVIIHLNHAVSKGGLMQKVSSQLNLRNLYEQTGLYENFSIFVNFLQAKVAVCLTTQVVVIQDGFFDGSIILVEHLASCNGSDRHSKALLPDNGTFALENAVKP